jgi:penicillin-binding protein 1B
MTASGRPSPARSRPKSKKKRSLSRRLLLGVGVPLLVAAAIGSIAIFTQLTLTFEGRLWTLPSRIYSAPLSIARGTALDREALVNRLARAGYARVETAPSRPGEFRARGSRVEAYLRAFPEGERPVPARQVVLDWSGRTVSALRDGGNRPLRSVDVEPELLALVFGPRQEERQILPLSAVPKPFVQAVLAAEDARFFSHAGVDLLAIIRASLANVRSGRIVQGASTITQQTVKNLYFGQERTWWRKIREAVMSVMLDARYSKDRILEVYLNEVYLGQRGAVAICGVEAAARHYFGRSVSDLTLAESATLAGLIRNPGGYNPFVHPDRAIARRDLVLDAMVDAGFVKKDAAEKAKRETLHLTSGAAGFAQARYVVDLVRSQIAEDYPPETLAKDGLRVFTTIDTTVQARAEEALVRGLDRLEREIPQIRRQMRQRRLQGVVVVTDPRTGAVLALVGGRDYGDSQFNRATQARRQPGSCFKPFVYLAAFEAAARGEEGGLTAASVLDDSPIEMRSGSQMWRPENYDGTFRGPVSARYALEHSLNVPTVRAAESVGLQRVVLAARRCGLKESFQPLPSLALGAQEVTPLGLAAAYGTFATLGLRAEPRIVARLEASDGKALARRTPEIKEAFRPEVAYLLDDVLRGEITEGTAASASALGFSGDAAGKTGTTDDTRDAWFIGFTPELLALVWVGYDDNSKTGLTGARGALPIWVDLMAGIRHRWEGSSFPEPPGIVHAEIDPETGQVAGDACPERRPEIFIAGTEPELCEEHQGGFRRWWRRLFHRDAEPRPSI